MRRQKGFWGQKSGVNDGSLYMRPTSDRSASTRSKRASFQDTDDCDDAASCTWCKPYRRVCTRCACFTAGAPYCPCRYTKDLTKIWKRQENLASFTRERTLIHPNSVLGTMAMRFTFRPTQASRRASHSKKKQTLIFGDAFKSWLWNWKQPRMFVMLSNVGTGKALTPVMSNRGGTTS